MPIKYCHKCERMTNHIYDEMTEETQFKGCAKEKED